MIHATILSAVVWRIHIHDVTLHTTCKHIGILIIYLHSIIALGINHAHIQVLESCGILEVSLKLSRSVSDAVGTIYQRGNKYKIFFLRKLIFSSLNLVSYISDLFGCRHTKILVAIIMWAIIVVEWWRIHIVHLSDEILHALLIQFPVGKECFERDNVGEEEVIEYHLWVIFESLTAYRSCSSEYVEERMCALRLIINNRKNPFGKFALAS